MKINQETVEVIKNFSAIQQSILIKPGSTLATMTPTKTIAAWASVPLEFPTRVPIAELSKFLGALSLFKGMDPDFEVTDTHIRLSDGKQTIEYVLGEESLISSPPETEPAGPAVKLEFDLAWADLDKAIKAMNVLGLQHLAITGADGKITLRAVDRKNKAKDHYKIEVGETDQVFETFIDKDNLVLMNKDYRVYVSDGLIRFKNQSVTYWIAASAPVKE